MSSDESYFSSVLRRFETDRNLQFWVFQVAGWGGLCVVTFLSLTVWYGTPNWRHVTHTLIQGLLGIALTVPLRYVYKKYWDTRLSRQFVVVLVSVMIGSALWTALRMQTFLWLGEEYDIWKDFGGWYFGSFMVFLSWAALYYGVKFYLALQKAQEQRFLATQTMQDEQLKRLSAETGSREAQIKMLRYQLNPHFLFNTLNSVSALVKTDRTDQARMMITQLSDFLRFSLDNDASQIVTLCDEIKALKLYLEIEKVRYGDRLSLEFDITPEAKRAFIPSLILQPLLENALKYAVAGRIDGGTILVSGHVKDSQLIMAVEDSGPGMDPALFEIDSAVVFEQGVGLKNIADRLNSHYGKAAALTFSRSKLGGLCACMNISVDLVMTPKESLTV